MSSDGSDGTTSGTGRSSALGRESGRPSAQSRRSYATIVADPPWPYPEGFAKGVATGKSKDVARDGDLALVGPTTTVSLPYKSMTVEEIAALPISDFATSDARLFLWTTNKWLREGFGVLDSWGFRYAQTLVWEKAVGGPFVTSVAPNTAEFVLVGNRGSPPRSGRFAAQVLRMPRGRHSVKPEAFQDTVEAVCPGPYLELFARRRRLGWDVWGNEVDSDVELIA